MHDAAPQLTLIVVIDQLSYYELLKARPTLTGGLKTLCDNGIFYRNAYVPNGIAKTAPGHAALATGTTARNHGIVENTWYDARRGKMIHADDDYSGRAEIFDPLVESPGVSSDKVGLAKAGLPAVVLTKAGKSAHNLMTDTLSDQLVLARKKPDPYAVYALSLKSVPAIMMAGRAGKALWLDEKNCMFTSSRAYFNELPAWVRAYNAQQKNSALPCTKDSHSFSVYADGLLGECACACIRNHFKSAAASRFAMADRSSAAALRHASNAREASVDGKAGPLVLWVSFSGFDYTGHTYGPNSPEIKRHLAALDGYLSDLLREAYAHVVRENVLVVLTADHGVAPIPEEAQKGGFSLARRINPDDVMQKLNDYLAHKYGYTSLVADIRNDGVRLDARRLQKISTRERAAIMQSVKQFLRAQDWVQDAWTARELRKSCFDPDDVRAGLKNQLYKDRSGDVIFLVRPYTLVDDYGGGTSHETPYNYDTHVPLIVYRAHTLEGKAIETPVRTTQTAGTLAQLLHVPQPATADRDPLPGVF